MSRERTLARIQAGEKLHMQFVDGKRIWWFDQPHQVVPDKVISRILSEPSSSLMEAGDSLFGLPLNSQTFVSHMGECLHCGAVNGEQHRPDCGGSN